MSIKENDADSSLIPAGLEEEFDGELLPVYIRELNSALNESFIDRSTRNYQAASPK